MRHIVFFIAYIYFLYNDFKNKQINLIALGVYAFVSLLTISIMKNEITMTRFVDVIFSVLFGLSIYLLSYFSGEGIGFADGIFFVINGFLLTLKENIILFLTGLLVSFVVGLVLWLSSNRINREDTRLPFMPCILPAVIGYILCIV